MWSSSGHPWTLVHAILYVINTKKQPSLWWHTSENTWKQNETHYKWMLTFPKILLDISLNFKNHLLLPELVTMLRFKAKSLGGNGSRILLIRAATLLPPLVAFPLIWWTLRMTSYKWARLRMRINRRNQKKKAADWVDFGSDDKERGTRKRLKRPRRVGLENEPGLLRYWPFFFIYLPDSLKQPSLNTTAFPSL